MSWKVFDYLQKKCNKIDPVFRAKFGLNIYQGINIKTIKKPFKKSSVFRCTKKVKNI